MRNLVESPLGFRANEKPDWTAPLTLPNSCAAGSSLATHRQRHCRCDSFSVLARHLGRLSRTHPKTLTTPSANFSAGSQTWKNAFDPECRDASPARLHGLVGVPPGSFGTFRIEESSFRHSPIRSLTVSSRWSLPPPAIGPRFASRPGWHENGSPRPVCMPPYRPVSDSKFSRRGPSTSAG